MFDLLPFEKYVVKIIILAKNTPKWHFFYPNEAYNEAKYIK